MRPGRMTRRGTAYTSRMSRKIRVGLVFGGRSCEHEVSLSSARSVFQVIDRTRYDLTLIHIAKDGEWRLPARASDTRLAGAATGDPASGEGGDPPPILTGRGADDALPILVGYPDGGRLLARSADAANPLEPAAPGAGGADTDSGTGGSEGALAPTATSLDVVFPLLHGPFGEDGTVQGLLELAGLPYVGAGVVGSAAAMDKAMMKRAFRAEGLPVMDYVVVRRSEWRRDPDRVRTEAEARLGYPMFVKPANLGSSVGVHRIDDAGAFPNLVEDAAGFDTKVLIEAAALDCHEIECAVLGNDDPQASVAGEIMPSRAFYDYNAKYVDDASELIIPAPIPPESTERVRELAIAAFRAVEVRGLARVDFFVERSGERRVFVNEINTMPGFTLISMYPKLWEASGIPYSELIDRLIRLAIEEHRDRRDVRAVL